MITKMNIRQIKLDKFIKAEVFEDILKVTYQISHPKMSWGEIEFDLPLRSFIMCGFGFNDVFCNDSLIQFDKEGFVDIAIKERCNYQIKYKEIPPKKMTVEEIEKQLGYKVEIVSN